MVSETKKLVWFGEIKWNYLVTRKQQILTRFPKDMQIFYIEPFVVGKEQHWMPKRFGNITVLTIPFIKNVPASIIADIQDLRPIRWLAGLVGQAYFQLWALLLGFAGSDRWVGLSAVHWGKVAARISGAIHFYDANDAHLDFPGTPVWLHEYLEAYIRVADLCFAVSPEIEKKISALGARDIRLLGNGVDFDHFSQIQPKPAELSMIHRPILGYAGAMDWLDTELIREVCLAYPEHEVVLIGPEIKPGWFQRQSNLEGLDNLHYLGKVEYQRLPAFVQQFEVAMIPFVVDELTRPLNPNKLYEYSAAGKPVVSMNYSSTIEGLRDIIYVAESYAEFISQVRRALKPNTMSRALKLAQDHSWSSISKDMLDTISEKSAAS